MKRPLIIALAVATQFEEARRLGPNYPLLRSWATFAQYREKYLEQVYSDENGYKIYRIRE